MRSVLTAIVVVGLLAAPGLAKLNVQVTADKTTLAIGEQVTVHILAQGSSSGLAGVAGGILASNPGTLQAVPGSFQWAPAFSSTVDFPQIGGSAASGGGWSGFGSMQTGWPPGAMFGKNELVEVAHYSVEAVSGEASPVTLSFNPYKVTGFVLAEVDGTEVVGTLSGVTITVPEPASLMLLTLGGLALLRRKQ